MLFAPESKIDIREQSPVALAFVGDGVFELLVRQRAVETTRLSPSRLHAMTVGFVSAHHQFAALKAIEPLLSEEESAVVRRGRNAQKASVSRHATHEEYCASTGFEALFGYLYLLNRRERLEELFEAAWDALSREQEALCTEK